MEHVCHFSAKLLLFLNEIKRASLGGAIAQWAHINFLIHLDTYMCVDTWGYQWCRHHQCEQLGLLGPWERQCKMKKNTNIVKISLTWLRRASAVWGVVATFKSWLVGYCVVYVFVCVCVCTYFCLCWMLCSFLTSFVRVCICACIGCCASYVSSPASRDSSQGRIGLGRWTWAPEWCSLKVYTGDF